MAEQAYRTLTTGCAFVLRQPLPTNLASPWGMTVYSRMTANRLRELDRFLGILLEEAARQHGGAGHDPAKFARVSTTGRKLRQVERMIGRRSGDATRLAAVARIWKRLRLPRPTGFDSHAADIALACGRPLEMPIGLRAIAEFYRNLADMLMGEISKNQQLLDFSAKQAQIEKANVACDGI